MFAIRKQCLPFNKNNYFWQMIPMKYNKTHKIAILLLYHKETKFWKGKPVHENGSGRDHTNSKASNSMNGGATEWYEEDKPRFECCQDQGDVEVAFGDSGWPRHT